MLKKMVQRNEINDKLKQPKAFFFFKIYFYSYFKTENG